MNRSIPPDVAEDTFQNSGGPDKLMPSFLGRSHSLSSQSSDCEDFLPSWFKSLYDQKLDTGWVGPNATDNTSPAAGDDDAAPVGRSTEAEELANEITSVRPGSFDSFHSKKKCFSAISSIDPPVKSVDPLDSAPMSTGIIHTDPETAVPLSPSPHTAEKSSRLAGAGTEPLRVTGFGPSGTARVRPKRKRKPDPEMKVYVQYDPDKDVLFGRGGLSNNNPGNQRYLQAKKGLQQDYRGASRTKKSKIIRRLVKKVRKWGGRFLDKDKNGWFEVHDKTAQQKVGQALRDK